jgi:hypothetical protein
MPCPSFPHLSLYSLSTYGHCHHSKWPSKATIEPLTQLLSLRCKPSSPDSENEIDGKIPGDFSIRFSPSALMKRRENGSLKIVSSRKNNCPSIRPTEKNMRMFFFLREQLVLFLIITVCSFYMRLRFELVHWESKLVWFGCMQMGPVNFRRQNGVCFRQEFCMLLNLLFCLKSVSSLCFTEFFGGINGDPYKTLWDSF